MALDTDTPQGTFEHIESLIRESAADLDKGIRGKKLGDLFEIQCRHYLQAAPEYRELLGDVWLWKDRKARP